MLDVNMVHNKMRQMVREGSTNFGFLLYHSDPKDSEREKNRKVYGTLHWRQCALRLLSHIDFNAGTPEPMAFATSEMR
jgi:hypothetical protein